MIVGDSQQKIKPLLTPTRPGSSAKTEGVGGATSRLQLPAADRDRREARARRR